MEKQSLIKYYCALLVVLVLLAGSNHAVAQTSSSSPSPTVKVTVTASPTSSSSANQDKSSPDKESPFPLIISILALVASGCAIALTILNSKKFINRIQDDDKKHTEEINLIKENYRKLSSSQILQSNKSLETSSRSTSESDTNIYLEAMIERHSERISELENKLKVTQSNQQSINYLKKTEQSYNLELNFNPFNQTDNLSQSEVMQPLENLAYIELVNTYNTNPKLLEQTAIKVSEPTDSINRRHSDSSQKIVLERANNSNYWVIHDVGIDCWLLPKSKLRIDQFRYETTKALFECHGYQPEYSTFKLVKPAKVVPLSTDEQTWQLEEPGILEFSVEAKTVNYIGKKIYETNNRFTMSFKKQELVEIYNESPISLVSKVVKVAVKQESITANNSDSIILASIGNGNYWIIYDVDINYWLLPKAKLRIDQYRYETVKLLFDCNDYEPEYHSFELAKPAQVSILANNSEWKLEKRGVLKFINPLTQKIQNKDDGDKLTISCEEYLTNPPSQPLYEELLEIYNNNPKLLEKKAIKVLETANSINRKRAGVSQRIVLEKATKSNYWVMYDNTDKACWLFFKNNMRISEYRYQYIQALFECYDYQTDYSSFKLVKPAKLISLATEEQKWIVEELGIIKFI